MNLLPDTPGAYALELYLPEPQTINIGRLGEIGFPGGIYIYFGSAYGAGGINARLGRHLRAKSKRLRWHIDYLREVSSVRAYCYAGADPGIDDRVPVECSWCQALLLLPGSRAAVANFGSSDCMSACPAHLVHFPSESAHIIGGEPLLIQGDVRRMLAGAINTPLDNLVSTALI